MRCLQLLDLEAVYRMHLLGKYLSWGGLAVVRGGKATTSPVLASMVRPEESSSRVPCGFGIANAGVGGTRPRSVRDAACCCCRAIPERAS